MSDASSSPADGVRVLVAEDDQRIRTVLERFLKAAGYDFLGCANGRLALEAWDAQGPFQVVITDINMPELSGEQLLRELKARDPRVPVIVLTARSDPGTITECFTSDAYRYLVKPFTRDDLMAVVRAAVEETQSRSDDDVGRVQQRQDEQGWVELTAPSRQEYLDRFQDFCDRIIASRLTDRAKTELKIAVQELGQNAIEWGNRLDTRRTITLSYRVSAESIQIRIADEGEGFDPRVVSDPTEDPIALIEAREQRGKRPGGFGIHLARKVMDTVSYNDRGNVVTLEKRFV